MMLKGAVMRVKALRSCPIRADRRLKFSRWFGLLNAADETQLKAEPPRALTPEWSDTCNLNRSIWLSLMSRLMPRCTSAAQSTDVTPAGLPR